MAARDHDADDDKKAGADGAKVEGVIDAVLAAPPKDFVAARDRAAAELKQAGDKAGAARVRALRRLAPSVWAINQLAHREPDAIEELLAAGADLIAAERRALAGDAGNFLADARAERQRSAALARRAEVILSEAGQRASAMIARRIARTLQAAAIGDEDTRAALRAGHLTDDLDPPSGFGSASPAAARDSDDRDQSQAIHAPRGHGHAPRGHGSEREPSQSDRPARRRDAPNAQDNPAAESKRAGLRTKLERARAIEQKRKHEPPRTAPARDHERARPARGHSRAGFAEHTGESEPPRAALEDQRQHPAAARKHRRENSAARREHPRTTSAAERKRDRETSAAARRRQRADATAARARQREIAVAAKKRERAAADAARQHRSALQRAAATADRVVTTKSRAVDRARAEVEQAEQRLRRAKDDLVQAELAARAARRAVDELD